MGHRRAFTLAFNICLRGGYFLIDINGLSFLIISDLCLSFSECTVQEPIKWLSQRVVLRRLIQVFHN